MYERIQDRFKLDINVCNHIINIYHFNAVPEITIDDIPLHKGNLFLGGAGSFKQFIIANYRITSVLSILDQPTMKRYQIKQHCEHRKIQNHKWIDLKDQEQVDIYPFFEESYLFIKDALKQNNVLIHCQAGVSRSASLLIAFLMKQYKLRFQQALKVVKKKRIVFPNSGFQKALLKYEQQLFKLKQ